MHEGAKAAVNVTRLRSSTMYAGGSKLKPATFSPQVTPRGARRNSEDGGLYGNPLAGGPSHSTSEIPEESMEEISEEIGSIAAASVSDSVGGYGYGGGGYTHTYR